jgi:hypothetical protein
MAAENNSGAAPASKVDDLIFRYSVLSDEERRQFDRKYASFRAVRRQFGGVFDRMRAQRPAKQPDATEKAK